MNFRHKLSFLGFILLTSTTIQAQDLIARQAPIDRKTHAVDSVSLQHLKKAERTEELRNLYTDWSNTTVHSMDLDAIPDSFKIDMRDFCMPTPSRKITSNYGYRRSFRSMHKGLDIKVYVGDTIRAAFSGKVRIRDYERRGYGYYIVIRHNNGLETVYGHMSKQLVNEGDIVKKGDPIGLGGNTGRSTGSHLHFEILFMGVTINPALMFDFEQQDIVSDYFTFYKDGITNKDMYFSSVAEPKEQKDETFIVDKKVSQVKYHKVKRGETLSSIANKVGTTIDKLCSLNRITKRQTLRPGQILRYEE